LYKVSYGDDGHEEDEAEVGWDTDSEGSAGRTGRSREPCGCDCVLQL
jgi:hypothetical protein